MASDKDLRDQTRAINALVDQMASLQKVAVELNRNLTVIARGMADIEKRSKREAFDAYVEKISGILEE